MSMLSKVLEIADRLIENSSSSAASQEASSPKQVINAACEYLDALRVIRCQLTVVRDASARRALYEKSLKVREKFAMSLQASVYVADCVGLTHAICEFEFAPSFITTLNTEFTTWVATRLPNVKPSDSLQNVTSLFQCVTAIAKENASFFVPYVDPWFMNCLRAVKKCTDDFKVAVFHFLSTILKLYDRLPVTEACRDELSRSVLKCIAEKEIRVSQSCAKCLYVTSLPDLTVAFEAIDRSVDFYSISLHDVGSSMSKAIESVVFQSEDRSHEPRNSLSSMFSLVKHRKRSASIVFDASLLTKIPSKLVPYVVPCFSEAIWTQFFPVLVQFVSSLDLEPQKKIWSQCTPSVLNFVSNRIIESFVLISGETTADVCEKFDKQSIDEKCCMLRFMLLQPSLFQESLAPQKWFEIWSHVFSSDDEILRTLAALCCSKFGDVFTIVNNCISSSVVICSDLASGAIDRRNLLLQLHGFGLAISFLFPAFVDSPSLVVKVESLTSKLLDICADPSVETGVCLQILFLILSSAWSVCKSMLPSLVDSFLLPTVYRSCVRVSDFLTPELSSDPKPDAKTESKALSIPSMLRCFAAYCRFLRNYRTNPVFVDMDFWFAQERNFLALQQSTGSRRPFMNASVDIMLAEIFLLCAGKNMKYIQPVLQHASTVCKVRDSQPVQQKKTGQDVSRVYSFFFHDSQDPYGSLSLDRLMEGAGSLMIGAHIARLLDAKNVSETLSKTSFLSNRALLSMLSNVAMLAGRSIPCKDTLFSLGMNAMKSAVFDLPSADMPLLKKFVVEFAGVFGDAFSTSFLQVGFDLYESYSARNELNSLLKIQRFLLLVEPMIVGLHDSGHSVSSWLVAVVSFCSTIISPSSQTLSVLCFEMLASLFAKFSNRTVDFAETLFSVSVSNMVSRSPDVSQIIIEADNSKAAAFPFRSLSCLSYCELVSTFHLLPVLMKTAVMSDMGVFLACFLLDGRSTSWGTEVQPVAKRKSEGWMRVQTQFLSSLSLYKKEVLVAWFLSAAAPGTPTLDTLLSWLSLNRSLPVDGLLPCVKELVQHFSISFSELVVFTGNFCLRSSSKISALPEASTLEHVPQKKDYDPDDENEAGNEDEEGQPKAKEADSKEAADVPELEFSATSQISVLRTVVDMVAGGCAMTPLDQERLADILCRVCAVQGVSDLSIHAVRCLGHIFKSISLSILKPFDELYFSQFRLQFTPMFRFFDSSCDPRLFDSFCAVLINLAESSQLLPHRECSKLWTSLSDVFERILDGASGLVKFGIDVDGHAMSKVAQTLDAFLALPPSAISNDSLERLSGVCKRVVLLDGEMFSAANVETVSEDILKNLRTKAVGCVCRLCHPSSFPVLSELCNVILAEDLWSSEYARYIDAAWPPQLMALFCRKTYASASECRQMIGFPRLSAGENARLLISILFMYNVLEKAQKDHPGVLADVRRFAAIQSVRGDARSASDLTSSDILAFIPDSTFPAQLLPHISFPESCVAYQLCKPSLPLSDVFGLVGSYLKAGDVASVKYLLQDLSDSLDVHAADTLIQYSAMVLLACAADSVARVTVGVHVFRLLSVLGSREPQKVLSVFVRMKSLFPQDFIGIVRQLEPEYIARLSSLESRKDNNST
eukprot:ANDGO_07177.mRNA.1 hypothetical protein